MNFIELFLLAIGLSMDAFAVSLSKGLSMRKTSYKKAIIVALYFGGFQALMPLLGYLLGAQFQNFITPIDHWIAFILLTFIGLHMIREAFDKKSNNTEDDEASLAPKKMLLLALATSIDALTVGITFAFLKVNIFYAITIIGLCTFVLSIIGVKLGSLLGIKYRARAELVGGIILIVMGGRILFSHLILA